MRVLTGRREEKAMKGILAIAVAAGLTLAGAATAQTKNPTSSTETMESESTLKHTGPGPNTKETTKTVVGVVKTYDAGKKIVVTGPKNKDYSFDLDDNSGVKGNVSVGEKVTVTYTKSNDGQKVTTVAPYAHKKTAKKETA
jgi:hypothetical protein